jgi:hypothetical protein
MALSKHGTQCSKHKQRTSQTGAKSHEGQPVPFSFQKISSKRKRNKKIKTKNWQKLPFFFGRKLVNLSWFNLA